MGEAASGVDCGAGALPGEADVVIIGAGVAGLACAAGLAEAAAGAPWRVLVLEASDQIGGRARSADVGGYPVDVGAGWVHGVEGNPLLEDGVLEPSDLALCSTGNIWTAGPDALDSSNFQPSADESAAWRARLETLGAVASAAEGTGAPCDLPLELRRAASGWSVADERFLRAFELWLGAPAEALPAGEWVPGARLGDFPGPHAVVRQGMPLVAHRLLARAGDLCEVVLQAEVEAVDEDECDLAVRAAFAGGTRGVIRCRWAVCTASLGALQREDAALAVSPPLPDALRAAIQRLRMSAYCKCILALRAEAAAGLSTWTWTDSGLFPMAFNYYRVLGKPLVACTSVDLACGDLDDEATVAEAAKSLGLAREDVLDFHVTRWASEPRWARGSYSFSPVGCDFGEADLFHDAMAGRRLLLAGEHTHEEHQGSVHGAYLSGKRAAAEILARAAAATG